MDFLRRNVFWLVCGIVTLGGVALGFTGMRAMPNVKQQMEASTQLHRNLSGLSSAPVNQAHIDAENRRVESIQADYDAVLSEAAKLYEKPLSETSGPNYRPLVPDALPNGPPLKLNEFRRRYTEAMNELFGRLKPGDLPTPAEEASMKERLENELAANRQQSRALAAAGEDKTASGVLTEAGVRQDPLSRAAIAKALSFWTYAVPYDQEKPPNRVSSLHFYEQMKDTGTVDAPLPFDIWMAQVNYWIQKDVVDAIVAVNEIAKDEAKAADKPAWVGTMAVKDIVSIRISSYVPPAGDLVVVAKPEGYGEAVPPGTAETVFTGTHPGSTYDVMQFTVKLVMDQRDILLLVDKICDNRFNTLVRVAYSALPVNRELRGKVYGSEPAVMVVLDFEAVMLGEVFRPLMPQSVCDFFEIPCPPPPA